MNRAVNTKGRAVENMLEGLFGTNKSKSKFNEGYIKGMTNAYAGVPYQSDSADAAYWIQGYFAAEKFLRSQRAVAQIIAEAQMQREAYDSALSAKPYVMGKPMQPAYNYDQNYMPLP